LGLWLDRFVSYEERRGKLERSRRADQRLDAPLDFRQSEIAALLQAFSSRHQAIVSDHARRGLQIAQFTASPDWRMVVGLGAAHVLETAMTLHRLYGFPVIPGSALKGLVWAYAETVLGKAPNDEELVAICGTAPKVTPMKAGNVIFFDAIPSTLPRFKLDVMNPHYGDYYGKKKRRGQEIPPADYLSPVPVYFLTVERTEFLFAVAARTSEVGQLVKTAAGWLRGGLQELGVGAKTTAGYGYMEVR
jgi:CRISPR-associated protein Cmr6